MELTLGDIRNKYQAYVAISSKKLPIKLSYAISKNLSALEKEANLIDNNRIKLAEAYAEKNPDGTPAIDENKCYVINEAALPSLNKEIAEYYRTVISIDICKADIKELDKLEDSRYDALSPAEISALDFMLEDATEN